MRFSVRLMLLVAVLLGGAAGCGSTPDPEPVLEFVRTTQSATSTSARGTITLHVTAADPQDSALSFSWEANMGSLGAPESTATTSEVVWTAPECVNTEGPPRVKVTVTNASNLSASFQFEVSATPVCAPTVNASDYRSLLLRSDGTVWAWGRIWENGPENETPVNRTPLRVEPLSGVVAVETGANHTLAVRTDGTVWAWGLNLAGSLGDGSGMPHWKPVQVSGLSGVVAVSAGFGHSLAVRNDGTAWAWGDNSLGQLGDGTTTDRYTPVQVSGLSGVVAVSIGPFYSLALLGDGTVWAWGNNDYGQLGDGTTTEQRHTPVRVSGLSGVKAISAGWAHGLAVRADGTVWAWGYNGHGQLGDGTLTHRHTPVQVHELRGAVAVAAGDYHSLAVRNDGTVWAWGNNGPGQLGDGTTTERRTPVRVLGLSGVTSVSAGFMHSLAMSNDGTVWAWGLNDTGQLGNGTSSYSSPLAISLRL